MNVWLELEAAEGGASVNTDLFQAGLYHEAKDRMGVRVGKVSVVVLGGGGGGPA